MKMIGALGVVIGCGAMLLGGCQSKGGPSYDIAITMDDRIGANTEVLVAMVGLSDIEYTKDVAAGEYDGEKLKAKLGDDGASEDWVYSHPDEGRSRTLLRGDDVWNDWRQDANWVMVMARIGVGRYDRIGLPLDKNKWGGREIQIEVAPEGLDLKTKQVVN